MSQPARRLDELGRCCGRKPIHYKGKRYSTPEHPRPSKFCHRCDRAYDPETGEQIGNWAYRPNPDGTFTMKYPT